MALTRITKGVIKPNENYDTHNINSTGIVTAIGLDVNGNGDISGNLSVGGVLTYEDVTSIDSIGIITARGGIDCNGDLDVDGHTELDNVNVSGIGTFADINVKSNPSDTRITSIAPGALILSRNTPVIYLKDNLSDNFDASIELQSNELRFRGGGNNATGIRMETTSTGVSFPQDIDVDGHTNLDNVSIAGVTTISHTGANQLVIKDSDTSGSDSHMRISFQDSGGTEKFFVGNDNNNDYLYLGSPSGQNNNIAFRVAGTDKLTISSSQVESNVNLVIPDSIIHQGDTNTKIRFPAADTFTVETGGSERLRIDSDGALLLGATSSRDVGFTHKLQLEGTSTAPHSLSIIANRANVHSASIDIAKSRGSSIGSNTIVQDGDYLGHINFRGADGVDLSNQAAKITGAVDGTPASNDIPGRLEFYTSTGGSSYERLRISSAGRILTGGETGTEVSAGGIHIKTSNNGGNTHALILENHGSSTGTQVIMKFAPTTSTTNDRWNSINVINVDGQNKFDTAFYTCPGGGPLEAMRIDNQQRLLIGYYQNISRHEAVDSSLQVSGTTRDDASIAVGRWSNDNQPAILELSKSRNGTISGHTAVQADDTLGQVQFSGSDGTRYLGAAFIKGVATNPIADYDVAGYLSFGTNFGTTSPTERLRITSGGDVLIADTTNSVYNDSSGGGINLKANGQIVTKKEATSSADPLIWLNDTGQTTNETIVLAQDGTKKASVGLAGNNLAFFVNGSEKVRIDNNGITTLKNFNGTGLRLQGSGGNYQGMQLQVTDASASQTRNIFIDAVNETGVAVANQVGRIQSDGGSYWSWSTQLPGDRTDRREERLRIKDNGYIGVNETSPQRYFQVTGNASYGAAHFGVAGTNGGNSYVGNTPVVTISTDGNGNAGTNDDKAIFQVGRGGGGASAAAVTRDLFRVNLGGSVQIGGVVSNNSDLDLAQTKLTIKQSANNKEDGIYLERSGERRGYYMYVGGAGGYNDALSISMNQLGTDTDVLAIDRGNRLAKLGGDVIIDSSNNGYGGLRIYDDTSGGYNVNYLAGRNDGNTSHVFWYAGRTQNQSPWSNNNPPAEMMRVSASGGLQLAGDTDSGLQFHAGDHYKFRTKGRERVHVDNRGVMTAPKLSTKALVFSNCNTKWASSRDIINFVMTFYTGASSATYHFMRMISQTDWAYDDVQITQYRYQYNPSGSDHTVRRYYSYYGGHTEQIIRYNQNGSGTGTNDDNYINKRTDFGPSGAMQIHQASNGGYYRDCYGSDYAVSLGAYYGVRLEIKITATVGVYDTGDYATAYDFYPANYGSSATQSNADNWNGPRGVWFNTTSNGTGSGTAPVVSSKNSDKGWSTGSAFLDVSA